MADKKDEIIEKAPNEIEVKKEPKKVKVVILANVKYGEAIHSIGEKIYILSSEVEAFEALKLVKKVVIEKEENEEGE